jgi:tricorn protease-like protein
MAGTKTIFDNTFFQQPSITGLHFDIICHSCFKLWEKSRRRGKTKKFNGEAALLFRACFHIEGDWRPFEDGILWENEGAASPVES